MTETKEEFSRDMKARYYALHGEEMTDEMVVDSYNDYVNGIDWRRIMKQETKEEAEEKYAEEFEFLCEMNAKTKNGETLSEDETTKAQQYMCDLGRFVKEKYKKMTQDDDEFS